MAEPQIFSGVIATVDQDRQVCGVRRRPAWHQSEREVLALLILKDLSRHNTMVLSGTSRDKSTRLILQVRYSDSNM